MSPFFAGFEKRAKAKDGAWGRPYVPQDGADRPRPVERPASEMSTDGG